MGKSAKIYALGTGSAIITAQRDNTAFLFILDEAPILVDFPGSIHKKFDTIGLNCLDVSTSLITHHHIDHVYGLPSFLHNQYLLIRRYSLDSTRREIDYSLRIFLPESSIPFTQSLMEVYGFSERPEMFPVLLNPLRGETGSIALFDDWRLTFVAGRHGTINNLGYIFFRQSNGLKIAYSGDSAPCSTFLKLAAGADLLIHDCQYLRNSPPDHSDAETLADALTKHGLPKTLAPVHFSHESVSMPKQVCSYIETRLGVNCIIPHDGELIFEA